MPFGETDEVSRNCRQPSTSPNPVPKINYVMGFTRLPDLHLGDSIIFSHGLREEIFFFEITSKYSTD
jgi:hypothetical protein